MSWDQGLGAKFVRPPLPRSTHEVRSGVFETKHRNAGAYIGVVFFVLGAIVGVSLCIRSMQQGGSTQNTLMPLGVGALFSAIGLALIFFCTFTTVRFDTLQQNVTVLRGPFPMVLCGSSPKIVPFSAMELVEINATNTFSGGGGGRRGRRGRRWGRNREPREENRVHEIIVRFSGEELGNVVVGSVTGLIHAVPQLQQWQHFLAYITKNPQRFIQPLPQMMLAVPSATPATPGAILDRMMGQQREQIVVVAAPGSPYVQQYPQQQQYQQQQYQPHPQLQQQQQPYQPPQQQQQQPYLYSPSGHVHNAPPQGFY